MGLEKLSIFGPERRAAIDGSLFRNVEILPSGDKKLVSLEGVMGGKFAFKTSLDKGGKSWSYSKREGFLLGGPLKGIGAGGAVGALMVGAGVLGQFSATSFQ